MKGEKQNLRRLGYKLVCVPHEMIEDHIACYRVKYEGKVICPPAAERLGIPLNEIWISDLFRPYARYILFHELVEIKHRVQGLDPREAHERALRDEEKRFRGDPQWERLRREINIAPLEELLKVPGVGRALAERIMEHRPFRKMKDLLGVPSIGPKRYREIAARFWCIAGGKGDG